MLALNQSTFTLAFSAFLPVGEITKTSYNQHLLQLSNIEMDSNGKSITIVFCSYKHKKTTTPFCLRVIEMSGG